jgi:hypothetical protein
LLRALNIDVPQSLIICASFQVVSNELEMPIDNEMIVSFVNK